MSLSFRWRSLLMLEEGLWKITLGLHGWDNHIALWLVCWPWMFCIPFGICPSSRLPAHHWVVPLCFIRKYMFICIVKSQQTLSQLSKSKPYHPWLICTWWQWWEKNCLLTAEPDSVVGGHLPRPGGLREREITTYIIKVTVEAANDKSNTEVCWFHISQQCSSQFSTWT